MPNVKLKLGTSEQEAIDRMIKAGLFNTRDEAIRVAIIKYAIDVGLLSPGELWEEIQNYGRRDINPEKLQRDLDELEDEA